MEPTAEPAAASVSNLVPIWDELDRGGSFEPQSAAEVVEQVVSARPMMAPEQVDAASPVERGSAFSYGALVDRDGPTWAERHVTERPVRPSITEELVADRIDELPKVDYDDLRRRDIARELLRARLVAIAERRERRSAYEIVFIMLAFAVAVLLVAPPLVQVLLAARGIQA
jgi:hypothetical protein